jgi:hypothetical protein
MKTAFVLGPFMFPWMCACNAQGLFFLFAISSLTSDALNAEMVH